MGSFLFLFLDRKFPKHFCLNQIVAIGLSPFLCLAALAQSDMAIEQATGHTRNVLSSPIKSDGSGSATPAPDGDLMHKIADNRPTDSKMKSDARRVAKIKKHSLRSSKNSARSSRKSQVMHMQIVPPLPTLEVSDKVNPFRGTGIGISKPMMTIPH